MPDPIRDAVIPDALERVFDRRKDMTPKQYGAYLETVAIIAIGGIRGQHGDEYARGFLEAALGDLDKPSQTFVAPRPPGAPH
jgi:hypothetical protein